MKKSGEMVPNHKKISINKGFVQFFGKQYNLGFRRYYLAVPIFWAVHMK